MTATAEQLARLRRMVNEPATTTYSDSELQEIIQLYPLIDANGHRPVGVDGDVNDAWMPTYDLNAAAADIWHEKAAALAGNYDFSTQGQSFNRSQAYQQAMQQARYYRSRRSAMTIMATPEPKYEAADYELGNE